MRDPAERRIAADLDQKNFVIVPGLLKLAPFNNLLLSRANLVDCL